MKHEYICVEQRFINAIGRYTSYGIYYKEYEDNILDDVDCDKSFVEYVVAQLNKYQVSPVHVKDVVENMLAVKYSAR